jgi:hypothetical protein
MRELRDRLAPLAYTTCVRLAEKGLLEQQRAASSDEQRSANAYIYTPRFSEAELAPAAIAPHTTPAPILPVLQGVERTSVEHLFAYLGMPHDADGQRTSDAALDLIAALLERAESAELRLDALTKGKSLLPRGRKTAAPVHEYRSRICRVWAPGATAASTPPQRSAGV